MTAQVEDKFENGYFWELYIDLEQQFENFLEYVPYLEGNEKVYSFRLLNLILSIGGHVDSAFKEMARHPFFASNDSCQKVLGKLRESERNIQNGRAPIPVSIKDCLDAFEKEYKLSQKTAMFKRIPEREDIIPFKPFNLQTNAPAWWDSYNRLKHDVGVNVKEANLQNARDALAGAFLLNVRHIPAAVRLCEYGIMKTEVRTRKGRITKAFTPPPASNVQDILRRGRGIAGVYVETPLFVYDYSQ